MVQGFTLRWPVISPNHDGRNDAQRIRFRLKTADVADVAIVDSQGDVVKEVASGLHLDAYRYPSPSPTWDGTRAPAAPHPMARTACASRCATRAAASSCRTRSVSTARRRRCAWCPSGRSRAPARSCCRTRTARPRGSASTRRAPGADADLPHRARTRRARAHHPDPRRVTTVSWGGRDAAGRPVEPGTYLAVAEGRDAAGNIGTSVPLGSDGRPSSPTAPASPAAAASPCAAWRCGRRSCRPRAGSASPFGVDARARTYTWTARRVGGPTIRRGTASRPIIRLKAPVGNSGVYLFQARVAAAHGERPFAVDDSATHRVLVVLPVMTWQGRNPVDDDGEACRTSSPPARA